MDTSPVPVAEVADYIDDLLNITQYEEDEGGNGLMVDAGAPVSRIAAAVNTSFTSIKGAADVGAQFLVVHHATWGGIDLDLKPKKEQALQEAGVSLYGAHASLDASPRFGNGSMLAPQLGVTIEGRFLDYCGGQAGVYGVCQGTFAEFVERAKKVLEVPIESWQNTDSFGRVGIATGGAGMTHMLEEARALGCDTYLTGEGSMYTKLYAREVGVNLVFGTHYATEMPGPKALAEHLSSHFALPWSFIPEDPDVL